MKTNASEPLMTCRKCTTTTSQPGREYAPGAVQRGPAYWLDGVRHEGGVSMVQALVWNVGTCSLDAKGEVQAEDPQG